MGEPQQHDRRSDVLPRRADFESESGVWRVLQTRIPLPFSVRGRMGRRARANWRDIIIAAELPMELARVVADVVRRSGLWPSERREVARELCAHFTDGLRARKTSAELIGAFGETKAAAKLIARAAKRKRPLWWKTWRVGLKATACGLLLCVTLYSVLFVVVMVGKPRVARAYAAEMSARLTAGPESQRAWPLYGPIRAALGPVPTELVRPPLGADGQQLTGDAAADMWPQLRTHARWPLAAAWVDARQPEIERLRKAAMMPVLGCPLYTFTRTGSPWAQSWNEEGSNLANAAPVGPDSSLLNILMPFCADSRYLGRILIVDIRRATELRDGARFAADAEALIGLAMQAGENRSLIAQLIRIALLQQACDTIREGLAADFLDEHQLKRIADRLGGTGDEAVRVVYDVEKDFLLDIVQRTYTDNGRGGGHITYVGLKQVSDLLDSQTPSDMDPAERQARRVRELTMLSPLVILADAGREETVALAEKWYARAQLEADTPLWQRGDTSMDSEVQRLYESNTGMARKHMLLSLVLPAFGKAGVMGEVARQQRDGTLVALALEVHRRTHGAYPDRLDELVPSTLPATVLDRYDGLPVRYRLEGDGSAAKPVVYSIGVDRTDDGGLGPARPELDGYSFNFKSPGQVKRWLADPRTAVSVRGDWILYDPAKVAGRLSDPTKPANPAGSNGTK